MTDKDLRRDVLDELDFDPSLAAGDIGVAAADGVVTLTGHVGSDAEKVAAARAVRRVRGVRAIAQAIAVRYADDKKVAGKPRVPPAAVKDKILDAFRRSALFEADGIKVTVPGDRVILEGAVTAWAERAAWSVPGVRAVEDRIVALA